MSKILKQLKKVRAELMAGIPPAMAPVPHKDIKELFYVCRALSTLDEIIGGMDDEEAHKA